MAFKKAEPKQAYLKGGLFGRQGAGKTITSLLWAEGLAKASGKKIAFVDTDGGTDLYSRPVPQREFHPEAFEFDALYTKSLSECLKEIKALDFNVYGVIVVDSITSMWDAAKLAFEGSKAKNGAIPLHAWDSIKRPYKELISFLMNCPAHVFICGREGLETENIDGTLTPVGAKMKAEGETPYEVNFLVHMKQQKFNDAVDGLERGDVVAYFEKDRTGIYGGRSVKFPNYDTIKPMVALLSGTEQRALESIDDVIEKDGALIESARDKKEALSTSLRLEFMAKLGSAKDQVELITIWEEVKTKRTKMYQPDFDLVFAYKEEVKKQHSPI